VEQQALVERARSGDRAAFTALARRYQEMAFGYALALVHDFHLAQDVTQEALLVAYRRLPALEDTTKFPSWLRGIVRFQCSHVVRRRCFDLVPLDYANEVALPAAEPGRELEIEEGFHRVLAAISALPDRQREVAMLFYIKDYSQREVAAFLDLPVTTVNNRLHAARKALKERLAVMSRVAGRVVAVRAPVVDVLFSAEEMPPFFAALMVTDEVGSQGPALQVVQRIGDGLVRCLAHSGQDAPRNGAVVVATGGPLLATVDGATLTRTIPVLAELALAGVASPARGVPGRPDVLETGIKAIDLLCPYARGGTAGLFGPAGTGRIVVSTEVLRNASREAGGLAIFAFIHGESEARAWYDAPDDVPRPAGAGQVICLLAIDNPIDPLAPAVVAASQCLDARTFLSFALARSGLYPAVDPLLSTSRLMDPAIVGQDHYEVACAVRRLLRECRDLQEGGADGKSRRLTASDRTLIARARKVQRFLTQPFAVAEAFTGRPGQIVPLTETIRGCKALLAGEYDGVEEEALMWRGPIDQGLAAR
jgi:RNA polymerase sigma factor (sigma-70 family)